VARAAAIPLKKGRLNVPEKPIVSPLTSLNRKGVWWAVAVTQRKTSINQRGKAKCHEIWKDQFIKEECIAWV
jgi:hypothetical protein